MNIAVTSCLGGVVMSDRKVWCAELERHMTAVDVWYYYFSGERYPEKLTFFCPCGGCSARMVIRDCIEILSPVCARFELLEGCAHQPDCTYE